MRINYKIATLFWVILYVLFSAVFLVVVPLKYAFHLSTTLLIVCVFQVYFNLIVLIPRYLEKKRYTEYVFASLILILLVGAFRYVVHDKFADGTNYLVSGKIKARDLRIIWFALMIIIHIGLHLITIGYRMAVDWEESKRITTEMKNKQLEAELKLLRLQLNPHFLFNTLNNIYTLTYLKKDAAAPMIMKLSESMRYMLSEANNKVVSLEHEIKFLNNYLELSRLKSPQFQKIRFESSGVKGYHQVAPLLLISFFENIVKHSDLESNEDGWAFISLNVDENDTMYFTAENTKNTKAPPVVSTGIGLNNIRKRLALLYPEHKLQVNNALRTFNVKLTLKLSTYELYNRR